MSKHQPAWPRLTRPLATVAIFAVLPFVLFLNGNRSLATIDLTLALYVLFLLLPGIALVVAAARLHGSVAAERTAVVYAAGTFLFFKFADVRTLVDHVGLPTGGSVVGLVWLGLMAIGVGGAFWLSRWRLAWTYALVAGLLLTGLPALQYAHFKATAAAPELDRAEAISDTDSAPVRDPDVYFFLLDGYARDDHLQSLLGYDNLSFLQELRDRNFAVHQDALAPYPVTLPSMAAILGMEYPLTSGIMDDRAGFIPALVGDNAVVESLRGLGYDYAFGSDYPGFPCDGTEDICIEPSGHGPSIGEREWAILAPTPLSALLPRLGVDPPLGGANVPMLFPDRVVDSVAQQRSDRPVFAYVHIIAPHTPYRYAEDCSLLDTTEGTLTDWGDPSGEGGRHFLNSVRCINETLLRAADQILAEDSDAVIIIASDHGPGFEIDPEAKGHEWSSDLIRERFAVLNATHFPPDCRFSPPGAELVVNTFRLVLSCLTDRDLPLLPARHYLVDYTPRSDVIPVPRSKLRFSPDE